ncbi:citrate/2-methylcitrate synthase [Actinomadura yumaensis]|uniref:citrate/2-methylcitrate synthase n=1 Tax=Actinomadura yumaensis TaxID=111807 RepID=UPI00360F9695
MAAADAVLADAERRRLPAPNVDAAPATLAAVAGMVPGAGEAVFAVARTAGWLAHALEEYERRSPLRPRAVYTGPRRGGPERAERGPGGEGPRVGVCAGRGKAGVRSLTCDGSSPLDGSGCI